MSKDAGVSNFTSPGVARTHPPLESALSPARPSRERSSGRTHTAPQSWGGRHSTACIVRSQRWQRTEICTPGFVFRPNLHAFSPTSYSEEPRDRRRDPWSWPKKDPRCPRGRWSWKDASALVSPRRMAANGSSVEVFPPVVPMEVGREDSRDDRAIPGSVSIPYLTLRLSPSHGPPLCPDETARAFGDTSSSPSSPPRSQHRQQRVPSTQETF